MVKNYNFWPLTPKFDPCYYPYDFQRFYIFFSSDALHKITNCLSKVIIPTYNNLIPPLLRSHVSSGLLRDHTQLYETKTDMIFEVLTCKTMGNQAVGYKIVKKWNLNRPNIPLYTYIYIISHRLKCYTLCDPIDEFQINEINVDLRTSGFDNEVLSVDACAVW